MDLLTPIIADASFKSLAKGLDAGQRTIATGSVGASVSLLASALHKQTKRPILIVCAHVDEGEDVLAETHAAGEIGSEVFPALELAPGESSVSAELFANRAAMIAQVRAGVVPGVLIAPIAALMQPVPSAQRIDELVREINRGDRIDPQALIEWMSGAGYERVDAIEYPGQFASRGGIIDIYPTSGSGGGGEPIPVRLDFFGDELDTIAEIDLDTMGSDRSIDKVLLGAAGEVQLKATSQDKSVLEYLSSDTIVLLAETFEIVEQGRGYFERISDGRAIFGPPAVLKLLETRFHALCEVNQFSAGKSGADALVGLPVETLPPFDKEVSIAIRELAELRERVDTVVLACGSDGEYARLGELLTLHAPGIDIRREIIDIRRGFIWDGSDEGAGIGRFALVPSGQMLHRSSVRRRMQKMRAGRTMDTFLDIQPDDYVVHTEHGIAKFVGLTVMDASGTSKTRDRYALKPEKKKKSKEDLEEYLTLEFAGRSRLHVPCSQIDLVQKYVGGFKGKPPLSSIGGKKWKAQKERVSESVKDLASEMLRVRAAREHVPGFSYPGDTPLFTEFEAEFPYDETEDQLAAMIEIKKDMQSSRPMDRLICGDVGFGKTEMAIRAAFKAVEAGRQVAVLVPTTVLAEQHERTFRNRFADFPFRVESLSRFKSPKQVRQTLKDLQLGRVDVVVGTHRLLSDDVKFAELGMVVIDEEQRFGVEHKEKLLRLRLTVDVLTLSATPIPRTLHMSMLGLRDISSLTTPPVDRRSIVTEVIPYNQHRVARAIQRELAREGQVYFVHNRVHNIESVADNIRQLVPDARIIIGHGQMNPHDLEKVMLEFMSRRADVLVSTTIIESGIDIPTANTMIINDADRFGLSELHQLRGRVGRSHHRAYCYMLLPEDRTVKEVAQKRLKAIEEYSMLGAGFKIAMRDLEIRGAGNLLGAEQSGHIAAVGYEMYCQLLDQTVQKLTNEGEPEAIEHTSVDIGIYGYIPKAYIPSDVRRIEAYRRLGNARSQAQIDQVVADLTSAYSDPPELVRRLILRARVRAACQAIHIRSVGVRERDIVMLSSVPERVESALSGVPADVRVVEGSLVQTNARGSGGQRLSEVYIRPHESPRSPMQRAKVMLSWLEQGTKAVERTV
ncbi:MAG: transcription-repair coupling factor [Phycisphaerae bacterium]|nr:transcription-repair coupling factor [Phycisphaerae bacterium]MBM91841.1 transcription-repair coupling factor [Phycisphaerae bacterium]